MILNSYQHFIIWVYFIVEIRFYKYLDSTTSIFAEIVAKNHNSSSLKALSAECEPASSFRAILINNYCSGLHADMQVIASCSMLTAECGQLVGSISCFCWFVPELNKDLFQYD